MTMPTLSNNPNAEDKEVLKLHSFTIYQPDSKEGIGIGVEVSCGYGITKWSGVRFDLEAPADQVANGFEMLARDLRAGTFITIGTEVRVGREHDLRTKKQIIILKPCPFCGGAETPEIIESHPGNFAVYCNPHLAGKETRLHPIGCGGQINAHMSAEEAAEAWNRRDNSVEI